MKKNLILTFFSLIMALGAVAKVGDTFLWTEWETIMGYYIPNDDYPMLRCEVVSDKEKTCKVIEIYNASSSSYRFIWVRVPNKVNRYTRPSGYEDYKIIEVCDYAFYKTHGDPESVYIYAPVIGDYAFYGINTKTDYESYNPQCRVGLHGTKSIGEYAFANTDMMVLGLYEVDTPPEVHENSFSRATYQHCVLEIPDVSEEVKALFRAHPVWSLFKHNDFGGVSDAVCDEALYSVAGSEVSVTGAPDGSSLRLYTMTGQCVDAAEYRMDAANTLTAPSPGLYILHYAGKAAKIQIRP